MRPVLWTSQEIACLRKNIVPPTRGEKAARTKAHKLGLSFCPGGCQSQPLNLSRRQREAIARAVKATGNKSHVANRFKVSRNYVIQVCKEFKVASGPSPHERLGEHVEYGGHNWSWKKGSWICTSSKVRASGKYNLGKVLWEKYHGEYPDRRHDVRFKDGDRYNLKKSNLVKLTKSEAQVLRMKEPMYKAMAYASGCMGLLMNAVSEVIDPMKKADRISKAVKTRKERHPDIGKKAWETRKKRAEERGYYFTEETRRKMSESHRGKPSNRRKNADD